MTNRRVLHVCPYYGMSWICSQLTNLSRYEPVVLYSQERLPHVFSLDHSYSLSDLSTLGNWMNRKFKIVFGFYPYYWRVARRYSPVLIHAHFGNFGYESLALKRILGILLVTTFYGFDMSRLPRTAEWKRKLPRLFRFGDAFLAEGPDMRSQLIELGCPEDKAFVQRLGVDVERIKFQARTGPAVGEIRILMCSNFVEKKGIPYGIRALAKVADEFPNAALRIGGDGVLREAIQALVDQLKLGQRVHLLGALDYPALLEELDKAHIFLAPSVTAVDGDSEGGAPVVLIEAQASGLPVVSTIHADIPEVVVDGKSGLLCKERDIAGLARSLRHLLRNPPRWASMAQEGRRHVQEQYDVKRRIQKLEDIYDHAQNSHRNR